LEVVSTDPPAARLTRLPTRGDVDPRIAEIREQLIIEFVSR
jgi:small subunit ribosomal protein S4